MRCGEFRTFTYNAFMIDAIEQAIKLHDQYQIEIKLDYQLLAEQDTHYRVATYIFIPQSLGITADSYQKQDFYRDVQNYIRLKTPVKNLVALCENEQTPLANIERLLQIENWSQSADLHRQLVTNCKLLSAMLKSALRDHFTLIERRINEASSTAQIEPLINNLVEEFLLRNEQITTRYRSFFASFNLPYVDTALFTAYKLTDEAISLLIEEGAVEMFQIVSTQLVGTQQKEFLRRLERLVEIETAHRSLHRYGSVLRMGDENEQYTFRASVLKKYAASVLYLQTAVSREGRTVQQLLFAVAAGISMIFATIVAFYFQNRYGNFTFPVFIALIVGYMFKDRIKELGRDLLSKYLQTQVFDRRTHIRSSDGRHKLGILREKVSFVKEEDIPKPVLRARNKNLMVDLDNDGQSELIIRYTKEITLYARAFKRAFDDFPKVTGLNDIMRYDIRPYLNKMAEPVQERLYVKNGQLQSIPAHKVYHLNIVSRYRSFRPTKEKLHTRTRLVLTRHGLKRVEQISL